jgi:hypothetical protein
MVLKTLFALGIEEGEESVAYSNSFALAAFRSLKNGVPEEIVRKFYGDSYSKQTLQSMKDPWPIVVTLARANYGTTAIEAGHFLISQMMPRVSEVNYPDYIKALKSFCMVYQYAGKVKEWTLLFSTVLVPYEWRESKTEVWRAIQQTFDFFPTNNLKPGYVPQREIAGPAPPPGPEDEVIEID